MLSGQSEWNTILAQVIAQRDFAAETVAASRQPHLIEIIFLRLNQNRNIQTRETQRLCHRFFIAKIWQQHDDTVDLVAMSTEQFCTSFGILAGFHTAELRLGFVEHDGFDTEAAK